MQNLHEKNNSLFKEYRIIYFNNSPGVGPVDDAESQQEKNETPLQQAEKKFKSELGYVGMRILVKYREIFSDEKNKNDRKKHQEFVAYGEAQIKAIALSPKDLRILKESGKYDEGYEFVNPFVMGSTTVHFQAKINNEKKIEPVILYEEKMMD